MAINQARSTKSQAKGSLAVSTKKRNVIYIDQYDPRASDKQYLASHPGQVIVLSDADFAKYLRQEMGGTPDNPANGVLLNDNEAINDFNNAISDIRPPGQPNWNIADTTYFTTDTGSYENITITFDPSPDDPLDGSFTYHVNYYPGTLSTSNTSSSTTNSSNVPVTGTGSSGSQSTSSQTASTTKSPVGTITTVNHTSSFFAIEWKALSNATNYTVTVTGWDIPGQPLKTWTHSYVVSASGGAAPNSHYGVGSLAFGIYTFTLTAASGFPFTGTYNISVQANYGSTSSTGVLHNVTI